MLVAIQPICRDFCESSRLEFGPDSYQGTEGPWLFSEDSCGVGIPGKVRAKKDLSDTTDLTHRHTTWRPARRARPSLSRRR